jgi:hypothetical protein
LRRRDPEKGWRIAAFENEQTDCIRVEARANSAEGCIGNRKKNWSPLDIHMWVSTLPPSVFSSNRRSNSGPMAWVTLNSTSWSGYTPYMIASSASGMWPET